MLLHGVQVRIDLQNGCNIRNKLTRERIQENLMYHFLDFVKFIKSMTGVIHLEETMETLIVKILAPKVKVAVMLLNLNVI